MILEVAWRNIWRNKTRSIVVIVAVIIGLFGGTFSGALMVGMSDQRIASGIKTECSHIQIHNPDFLANNEAKYVIPEAGEILAELNNEAEVIGASRRSKIIAMAATAETGSGTMIYGIHPEQEMKVTDLYDKIIEGSYFETDRRNPVVIGQKLAKKLNAGIRSKIVLTFQSADGNITGGAFRVCGIYKTTNTGYDEMNVFVRNSDLSRIGGFNETAGHEIVVYLSDNEATDILTAKYSKLYPGLSVEGWKEIRPDLGMMNDMMGQFTFIFVGIILLALAFGIINTMLMVVLERVKELGMLMAIGMSRIKVFMMIMLETIFLSLTGGLIGMGISELVIAYYRNKGIDFSSFTEGFESMGYSAVVYPDLDPAYYITLTFLVIFTAIVASIYPAIKALKLNPCEALRTE